MNPGMIESEMVVGDVDECDFDEPACDLSDIEVESSSAMWVDEATPPMPTTNPHTAPMAGRLESEPRRIVEPVALPSALFGDFEIEEDLSLRGDVAGSIEYESDDDDSNDAVIPFRSTAVAESEPAHDLEAMLHQEIIGLSSFDDSVMVLPEPMDCQSMDCQSMDGTRMNFDSFDDGSMECESAAMESDEDCRIRLSSDDSDLLIIEDELELTRTDGPSPKSTAAPQSMTIDFQSMLTRMRAGS